MSSLIIATVVSLENVRRHPNADALELADVLGYQVVVPLGKYKTKDKAVYVPADAVVPDEWANRWGVKKYLRGQKNDRVGRAKLRGEPSFGLIVDIPIGENWDVGFDCTSFLGITKYEPPVKVGCGDAAGYDEQIDPFFQKFTDVQNGRIFTDVFTEGEEVIFTEKIHGTNCRIGSIGGRAVAGSMEVRRAIPNRKKEDGTLETVGFEDEEMKRNTYWFPWSIRGVRELLKAVSTIHTSVILYGEVYGGSVQSLDYGIASGKGVGFRAFGLRNGGKFMDWDEFAALCKEHGVETVPVLWRGAFSMAKAKELADGTSTMAGHIREGTVAYPVQERLNPKVGRAILKFIGTEYELSKHLDMDVKDV